MSVLNTSAERVKLLKAGIDGKKIEEMWVERNNFKLVQKLLKSYEVT